MGENVVRKGSYGEYRKVHYVGVPTALFQLFPVNGPPPPSFLKWTVWREMPISRAFFSI